ncbi:MAG: LysM peptidoglycan-binding domain-containing protein [Chloroflexi bacterium]|nr:MAG: LysM peptidoglycan-binding domain-containing protein [Chloroflexota bacterium]
MQRNLSLKIVLLCALMLLGVLVQPLYAQDDGGGVTTTEEVTDSADAPKSLPTATLDVSQNAVGATNTPTPTEEPTVTPTEEPQQQVEPTTYTVQRGDNLFRIALRFNVSRQALAEANGIVNPSLIFVGQQLVIPGTGTQTTSSPSDSSTNDTTTSSAPMTYVVARGDTLFRIAARFGTTVSDLVAANNLSNRNLIFVGQRLIIPGTETTGTTTPSTTDTATSSSDSSQAVTLTSGFGFDYGIEAFLIGQDSQALAEQVSMLGMNWVKQEVNWRDIETTPGQIDFATLDEIVNVLEARDLNILFTVSTSPAWARTSVDEDGPPDNFTDYADFVQALAERYAGRVQAFEIWNEPNLRREWNSTIHEISAASYTDLLRAAYEAIKEVSPSTVVVSAGLSPTGFNDGVNAINDRVFLNAMYANGLADIADAVGAHPNGWANPPDAVCCDAPVGVETHFEDPSFYFLETLNDYREIMLAHGASTTPIWVTRFGWGSSEDTDPPAANNIFFTYTSLGEQAIFDSRGFELGAELGFVGPMFLYNLNACQAQLDSFEGCYYSLINLDGMERPVFAAIQQLDKGETQPVSE